MRPRYYISKQTNVGRDILATAAKCVPLLKLCGTEADEGKLCRLLCAFGDREPDDAILEQLIDLRGDLAARLSPLEKSGEATFSTTQNIKLSNETPDTAGSL
jgi:hypothetical protein